MLHIQISVLLSAKPGKGMMENWKFKSRGWVEKILFDTLKWNTKKLKCFELQMIGKKHKIKQHIQ